MLRLKLLQCNYVICKYVILQLSLYLNKFSCFIVIIELVPRDFMMIQILTKHGVRSILSGLMLV